MAAGKPTPSEPAIYDKVMFNGENLMKINASTVGKYARKVAFKIWSAQDLVSYMISPKKAAGSHCRQSIDSERKLIWEGWVSNFFTIQILAKLKAAFELIHSKSLFLDEIKKKYKNNPLGAYEDAKESVNRIGSEIMLARKNKANKLQSNINLDSAEGSRKY